MALPSAFISLHTPDHSHSATLLLLPYQPQLNPYLLLQQIMKLTRVVLTASLASSVALATMLRGDIHQRVLIEDKAQANKGTAAVVPHSDTEGDKHYGYGYGGGGGQQQQQQQQQGGGDWGGGGQQQQQQQQQQGGRGWRVLAEDVDPGNDKMDTNVAKVAVPIEEWQDKQQQQQQQQQMNGPFGTMQQQQQQQQVRFRVEKKALLFFICILSHFLPF